jgi:hypothetical protein
MQPLPPNDDLAEVLKELGTYQEVARVLGCSSSAVWLRLHNEVRSPLQRGGRRSCAVCKITSEDKTILVFGLKVRQGNRARSISAGTLLLCETCWTANARGKRPTAAARRIA